MLEAGDGGFLGGMTTDKYSKITAISKPTATRDLTQLLGWNLLVATCADQHSSAALAGASSPAAMRVARVKRWRLADLRQV